MNIYADRNKLLWKEHKINIWLKAVAGNIINCIEESPNDIEIFRK